MSQRKLHLERLAAATGAAMVTLASSACHPPRQRTVVLFPAAQLHDGAVRTFAAVQPYSDVKQDDAIVSVTTATTSCTGTLIAEDLVLTAHHCVATANPVTLAGRDMQPDDVTVQIGDGDLPWAEVGVRAVVSPPCGYRSGRGDIAILVLSRRMLGFPVITPRLEAPPEVGEAVLPFGFGRCVHNSSHDLRAQRSSQVVARVEPWSFVSRASICPGDSGGPVLVEQTSTPGINAVVRELVGVISASAMDGDDRTEAPSVYTRVDAWRSLFATASAIARGSSPSELPPVSCDDN